MHEQPETYHPGDAILTPVDVDTLIPAPNVADIVASIRMGAGLLPSARHAASTSDIHRAVATPLPPASTPSANVLPWMSALLSAPQSAASSSLLDDLLDVNVAALLPPAPATPAASYTPECTVPSSVASTGAVSAVTSMHDELLPAIDDFDALIGLCDFGTEEAVHPTPAAGHR